MEPNWTEIIIALITTLVTAVLVPFLTIYLRKLAAKADAEIAKIEDQTASTAMHDLLWKASDEIDAAVKATAQTYVDSLKKANAFDAAAQANAASMALETFKTLMGQAGMDALEDIIGDAEAWARSRIEAAVKENKPAAGG